MASTYTSLNVHIILATKDRTPSIHPQWMAELHAYMGGTIRELEAAPLAIGGVANHVHALVALEATHCVANVVRETMKSSSTWALGRNPRFAWQTGYRAFRIDRRGIEAVARYFGRAGFRCPGLIPTPSEQAGNGSL